jgi:hypothetical protein
VKNRGQIEPELNSLLKKKGGFIDKGLQSMFQRKGVIIAHHPQGSDLGKCSGYMRAPFTGFEFLVNNLCCFGIQNLLNYELFS